MTKQLKISIGQCSHQGVKEANEDFYGALLPPEPMRSAKGIAVVIADGMSAAAAGREAAECACKGFLNDYYSTPESWTVKHSGGKVLTALNNWLYSKGQAWHQQAAGQDHGGGVHGLVTTFSVLVIKATSAYLFHVGDSRIYRLRGPDLEQLTHDHRVWVSEQKNYLNRAMGIDVYLDIDYRNLPVEPGDRYLLTTDGVHDYLDDKEMLAIIEANGDDLEAAAREVVDVARGHASQDNLTCQIVRVDTLPSLQADDVYAQLTELPFPPELAPGMVLDGYRILSELHLSPTSQLYKAEDTETGEVVVVKTPSVNFQDDPAYLERFLHEEWVGRRISNPHVLQVRERGRPRQCLYYVTEYVQGQTLRQWMDEHPKAEFGVVMGLIEQITAGLRAFHRLEMLHQDLKPDNVMIEPDGNLKIIDFGSVKIAGIAELPSPVERNELLGTKNYTAPEYLGGQPGSPRSDLFSLGVITYEMLTGELPYGEAMGRKLSPRSLCKLVYHPSYHVNPMIPLWLDGALEKAVRCDPRRRYEHFSEFLYDLTHPNPQFIRHGKAPLMERNPLLFWKVATAVALSGHLLWLYFWVQGGAT